MSTSHNIHNELKNWNLEQFLWYHHSFLILLWFFFSMDRDWRHLCYSNCWCPNFFLSICHPSCGYAVATKSYMYLIPDRRFSEVSLFSYCWYVAQKIMVHYPPVHDYYFAVLSNVVAVVFGGIEFSVSGRTNFLQYKIGVCYYLLVSQIFPDQQLPLNKYFFADLPDFCKHVTGDFVLLIIQTSQKIPSKLGTQGKSQWLHLRVSIKDHSLATLTRAK